MSFQRIGPLQTLAFCTTSVAALLASGELAAAEENKEASNLEEVVVTGVRASIISARNIKRDEVGVVDAISAEDLGKFPDINLSETLQRVPGITLNRTSTGSGTTINLRGLAAEYTRVQINGMTAPSADAAIGRGFDFQILPSELFTKVVVHKTASARQTEGGLAGLVEMSTPRPFDYQGFTLTASGQGDHSDTLGEVGTRGSLLISNNWNDTFGIAAAFVYAHGESQSNRQGGFNVRPFALTANDGVGTPEERAAYVTNIPHYVWNYSEDESKSGNVTLQWRPSSDVEITVGGLYSQLDATRYLTRFDAPNESNVARIDNAVIRNGIITSGTFFPVQQRVGANNQSRDDELMQAVASVTWTPSDDWTIKPFVGYTERKNEGVGTLLSFRRADLSTGLFHEGTVSYQHRGKYIDWSTDGTDFSTNPEEFLINVFYVTPTRSKDSDIETRLDFQHTFGDSALKSFDFGVRYSDRKMDNFNDGGVVVRAASDAVRPTLPSLADTLRRIDNFSIRGAVGVPGGLNTANIDAALALWLPNGTYGAPIAGAVSDLRTNEGLANTYDLREETSSVYGELTFELDRLLVNAGLRFLNTDQTTNGTAFTNEVPRAVEAGSNYQAFLPSASLRYELRDDMYVRAAYARSFTRPALRDLAPTEDINGVDEGGGFGTQGNPGLTPFTADNIDLGVEWYFGDEGLLSATLFYKSLDGIIDTETFTENRTFPRQRDGVLVTAPVLISRPANGVSAKIKGLELGGQMRLTFLPQGWMQNFGVQANYTYADSSADFNAENDVRSSGLPGLSRNSMNVSIYYDDQRFSSRLAYAWRSDYLSRFAAAWGIPEFQNSYGQLDWSANYNVTDGLQLNLQVLNLTKEVVSFTSDAIRAPDSVVQLDRRILFGARYTF